MICRSPIVNSAIPPLKNETYNSSVVIFFVSSSLTSTIAKTSVPSNSVPVIGSSSVIFLSLMALIVSSKISSFVMLITRFVPSNPNVNATPFGSDKSLSLMRDLLISSLSLIAIFNLPIRFYIFSIFQR